jgi:hypothetical protein
MSRSLLLKNNYPVWDDSTAYAEDDTVHVTDAAFAGERLFVARQASTGVKPGVDTGWQSDWDDITPYIYYFDEYSDPAPNDDHRIPLQAIIEEIASSPRKSGTIFFGARQYNFKTTDLLIANVSLRMIGVPSSVSAQGTRFRMLSGVQVTILNVRGLVVEGITFAKTSYDRPNIIFKPATNAAERSRFVTFRDCVIRDGNPVVSVSSAFTVNFENCIIENDETFAAGPDKTDYKVFVCDCSRVVENCQVNGSINHEAAKVDDLRMINCSLGGPFRTISHDIPPGGTEPVRVQSPGFDVTVFQLNGPVASVKLTNVAINGGTISVRIGHEIAINSVNFPGIPVWSATTAYVVVDFVRTSEQVYEARRDSTGVDPENAPNSTYWKKRLRGPRFFYWTGGGTENAWRYGFLLDETRYNGGLYLMSNIYLNSDGTFEEETVSIGGADHTFPASGPTVRIDESLLGSVKFNNAIISGGRVQAMYLGSGEISVTNSSIIGYGRISSEFMNEDADGDGFPDTTFNRVGIRAFNTLEALLLSNNYIGNDFIEPGSAGDTADYAIIASSGITRAVCTGNVLDNVNKASFLPGFELSGPAVGLNVEKAAGGGMV